MKRFGRIKCAFCEREISNAGIAQAAHLKKHYREQYSSCVVCGASVVGKWVWAKQPNEWAVEKICMACGRAGLTWKDRKVS